MDTTTADHQQQVELIDELVNNVITSNLPKITIEDCSQQSMILMNPFEGEKGHAFAITDETTTLDTPYCSSYSNVDDVKKENQKLRDELNEMREKLKVREEQSALECEVYKDGQEKQLKIVEKLQTKVMQYRDQCNELRNKLESVTTSGIDMSQLPSAVRQLELKVRELEKQKKEMEQSHIEEVQGILEESKQQTQKALQLAVSNTALQKQLKETQQTNTKLTEAVNQLSVCRDQLELQLKTKEEKIKLENDRHTTDYINSLSNILNDTSSLHEEFHKIKSAMMRDIQKLNEELTNIGDKIKSQVNSETQKHKPLEDKLSTNLKKKEKECDELNQEILSLQKDYNIQTTRAQLTIEQLEKELTDVKITKEELQYLSEKTARELQEKVAQCKDFEKQLASLLAEQENERELEKKTQSDVNTMREAISSIVNIFTEIPDHDIDGSPSVERKEALKALTPLSTNYVKNSPKIFGTKGDLNRFTNWAISVVQHGVSSQNTHIVQLQSQLTSIQDSYSKMAAQLKEGQSEVKVHLTAGDILKEELQSCHDKLTELTESKARLEVKIEEITREKMEADLKLSHYLETLKSLDDDRKKVDETCNHLKEKVKGLTEEIKENQVTKEGIEADASKKSHLVQRLQQQLRISQEEIEMLQKKLTNMNSKQLDVEKSTSDMRLKVASFETERDLLQKELNRVQHSEQSLLERVVEFQRANSLLESEKRYLQQSLGKVVDVQMKLDEENTDLHQQKLNQEDEVEQLRLTNRQLTDRVGELDKNLHEMESICGHLRREKDGLRQEATLLNDAFVKTRQTLSEVQIQRSKLNQSIAKIAQEKSQLVQDKVQLSSKIVHLEEALQSSQETNATLTADKEQWQLKVEELEAIVAAVHSEKSDLEKTNIALQEEKQTHLQDHTQMIEEMRKKMTQMQEKHENEMKEFGLVIQTKESEYHSCLSSLKTTHKLELVELTNSHNQEILLNESNHKEVVDMLRSEMVSLSKKHHEEVTKLSLDKQTVVGNLEKEKELLQEKLAYEQKIHKEKCNELEDKNQHMTILCSELKCQFETAEKNVDRLSKELNKTEEEIQKFQATLNRVKTDAEMQIKELHTDLLQADTKISQLEVANKEYELTIKYMATKEESTKTFLEEAQKILESINQEKDAINGEKLSLERKLASVQTEYDKAKETLSHLETAQAANEEVKNRALKDCSQLRKALQFSEQALSKLTSEHRCLEQSLTSCQKECNDYRLQLTNLKQEKNATERLNEELEQKVVELQGNIEVLTAGFHSKEEEVTDMRQMLSSLREDRDQFKTSILHLEESSRSKEQLHVNELALMKQRLQEMKSQRVDFLKKVQSLEACSNNERKNTEKLQQQVLALQETKLNLEDQLTQVLQSSQELRQTYNQITAILEGTLQSDLTENSTSPQKDILNSKKSQKNESFADFSVSFESGIESPDLMDESRASPIPNPGLKISPYKLKQTILELHTKASYTQKCQDELNTELDVAHNKLASINSLNEELEGQVIDLQKSLKTTESSFELTIKKNQELEERITQQVKEIATLKSKQEYLLKQLEATKEHLEWCQLNGQANEDRIKKYINDLVEMEVEKRELQEKLKHTKLSEKLLEEELTSLKKEKEHWELVYDNKEVDLKHLQEQQQSLQITFEKVQREAQEMQSQLEETQESLTNSTVTRNNLENELRSLKSEVKFLTEERELLISQLAEVESKLKLSEANEKKLEKEVEQMMSLKVMSDDKEKIFHQDNAELKEKLSKSDDKRREIESKMLSLKATIGELSAAKALCEEETKEAISMKETLEIQVQGLQTALEVEKVSSNINKELCEGLDKEIETLRQEVQRFKKEKYELEVQLENAIEQAGVIDKLLVKQNELNKSFVACSMNNADLITHIRELEKDLLKKEQQHKQEVQTLHDVQEKDLETLKTCQKFHQTQWEGREAEYKKMVKHLEKKIVLLEGKLFQMKNTRDELVNKVESQEKTIAHFQNVLSGSLKPATRQRVIG